MPARPTPEMTVKAVVAGLLMALVFGSANAYLGMKAGQTIASTIPAAVIAIALFRLPFFRGGILEQNITRTAASVGEALVAGAIFTIPAFMLVELNGVKLWSDMRSHFGEAVLILVAGGLLGVFFIIALRRPLCVDANLPWPESVASAQITRAGEKGSDAPKYIFGAMGLGGLIQFLKSDKGIPLMREYTEGFLPFSQSTVKHFDFSKAPIGDVVHAGGIPWATPNLSPALLGIGYIIGPRLSAINFAGGLLAWWVLIPLLLFFDPDFARRTGGAAHDVASYTLWYNVVRPIAVGTMLVAAANTLFGMRQSIAASIKGAIAASTAAQANNDPSERDIPFRWLAGGTALLTLGITIIYWTYTGGWTSAIVAAAVMSAAGFLLSAVGGYLVGLVGGSNQPVSGLTLSALVIAALVMLAMGVTGAPGTLAVLGVASVVCCACCVSGSLIQDLKAGQLLGGTPWKMEVVEIIAVILMAVFLMLPIIALHEANLATGGIGGRELPAPQAGLMAQLAKGIVGGQMAWGLIAIGAAFGVALIATGARAPMLIAVGMYLPFDTSSAIFAGGLIAWAGTALARPRTPEQATALEERGTLVASGLIAGEAIMGILLAVAVLAKIAPFATLPSIAPYAGWTSLAGFAAVAWVLMRIPAKAAAVR